MRSLVSLRAAAPVIARSLVGFGLLAALSYGCGVDNSGLGETSTKLQPTGGTGGTASATGAGGDTASGGVSGAGGALGSGGSIAVGGAPGSGGDGAGGTSSTGSGGVIAAGGAPANGGAPGSGGADATGGTLGTGGTTATGTGGVTANGGAPGSGGAVGTGGVTASGGNTGTGGVVATGGANGTGGAGTGGGGGTPCGPANCTGCCSSDGQCVRNVTAQQCGTKGAACVACGPCQICGSATFGGGGSPGTCTIDPASQWTIVADSAQISKTAPGGGNWDPFTGDEGGSAPDPFCEYENPANDVSSTTAGVTSTVTDSFAPSWNQQITPSGVTVSASALMAAKPAWRIWVGDEDCSSPRNCGTLGQTVCSYQQPISAEALMSGGLTISNYQSCVSLTLSFVCQP